MPTRRALAGYDVYVDGVEYLGTCTSFTPPTIESQTTEANLPGHGGSFDVASLRLSKMEATLVMGDAFPALERLAANPGSIDVPIHLVSAHADGAGALRRVEHQISGLWTKQEAGETSGGDGGGDRGMCTYTIGVRVYTHRVDGAEVRHVDLEQNIHRIAGRDVNQELRDALRRRG